ncbi:hypothetical protein [Bradyrhizobium lablabi]|uniref:hypothetical protein n=1 Tax=Bradyrhizobium lablabi TaxID=722472 RepID=UPI001BAE1BDD|nr:hypothetical protein [Bradyrhizobium lablabi]MBR0695971.1 hypothetical protein [Bradyrhizobium lablabi]
MSKVSLSQQIDAVETELRERRSGTRAKMSRSVAEFHTKRLEAAAATLRWLQDNEARIKGALEQ